MIEKKHRSIIHKTIWSLCFVFLFSSCLSDLQSEKPVVVEGGASIFMPVKIFLDGEEGKTTMDLGEFTTDDDPVQLEIEILNQNSKYKTSDLLVQFADRYSTLKFTEDDAGESNYPGKGGDCGTEILPESSCKIYITYTPSKSEELVAFIDFSFKDLLEPKTHQIEIKAKTGVAATLFPPEEITNFDFGPVERTQRETRFQEVIIQNSGEIAAGDIDISLVNSVGKPFKIDSHDCSERLEQDQNCRITVSYTPENYRESDIEQIYNATLTINYSPDRRSGKQKKINFYFASLSTEIQGVVEAAGVDTLEFDDQIEGNFQELNFKFSNNGWQAADIKRMIIRKSDDSFWAQCLPSPIGAPLACYDESGITELDLEAFPFKIVEDGTPCLGEMLDGKTLEVSGASCFYKITFWPSILYDGDRDFSGTKIFVEYDSRWRLEETIRTPHLFTVNARSTRPGRLQVVRFQYANRDIGPSVDAEDSEYNFRYFFNQGRIAKVTSSQYSEPVVITLRNTGNSPISLTEMKDGKNTPITATTNTIDDYYISAAYSASCENLTPGGLCNITYRLAPVASNPAQEDQEFYDVLGDRMVADPSADINSWYKQILINYNDGSTFNDDGTERADRNVEIRSSGILISKGYMVVDESNFPDLGRLGGHPTGQTYRHRVILKNVGTGGIPYIQMLGYSPSNWASGPSQYPVRPVAYSDPSDPDYMTDCYSIVDLDAWTDTATPPLAPADNGTKLFPPGNYADPSANPTHCALTFEFSQQSWDREVNSYVSPEGPRAQFEHFHAIDESGSIEAWNYRSREIFAGVNFTYFDGDSSNPDFAADPVASIYGAQEWVRNLTAGDRGAYQIMFQFRSKPHISIREPLPLTSAIVYRPEYDLPALNVPSDFVGTANDRQQYSAVDTPLSVPAQSLHFGSFISGNAVLAGNSLGHVSNWESGSSGYDFTVHAGTFPADGETYDLSFEIYTIGETYGVNIASITEDSNPSSPLQLVDGADVSAGVFLMPDDGVTSHLLSFEFTPQVGVSQTYERIITISYNSSYYNDLVGSDQTFLTATRRVRVIAESFANNYPDIKIDVKEFAVDLAGGVASEEAPTGGDPYEFENLTSYFNQIQADTARVSFEGVVGSEVYEKRRFYVTNTSVTPIENMSIYMKGEVNSYNYSNATAGIRLYSGTCQSETTGGNTLIQNEECYFDVEFKAGQTTQRFISINYDLAPGQTISKLIQISTRAIPPATLRVAGKTRRPVVLSRNDDVVFNQQIHQYDLGAYGANGAIVLDQVPTSKWVNQVTIVNDSELKASFLRMFGPRDSEDFQDPYVQGWSPHSDIADADPDGDGFYHIWQSGTGALNIYANDACMYGDDDPSNPEAGFNDATVSPCYLNIEFRADHTYLGDDISTEDEYAMLRFYDNKRTSSPQAKLWFGVKGFVEPNPVIGAGGFSNITATDDGTIEFDFGEMNEDNLDWGDIIGYRVFQADNPGALANLFTVESNLVAGDLAGFGNRSFSGSGTNGQFSYFRVAPIRSYNPGSGPIEYISDSPFPVVKILVPPLGMNYLHDEQMVIDRDLLGDTQLTRAEAVTACATSPIILRDSGVSSARAMTLIPGDVWENYVMADPAGFNDYDSYGAWPTWIGGPLADLDNVFVDYDYLETTRVDYDEFGNPSQFYSKDCEDNSCDIAEIIFGGYLPNAWSYFDPALETLAFPRCMIQL